jgi:hypothetical protein
LPSRIAHTDARQCRPDIDRQHLMTVAYLGAVPLSFARQQMVETRALDLIRGAPPGGKLVREIEHSGALAMHEHRAVLRLKARSLNRLKHTRGLQIFHALRQETLADTEAGELLAFEHQYVAAALAQ